MFPSQESIQLLGEAATQVPVSWPELGQNWIEALMTPVSFVILGAGVLGLLVGFLVGKGSEYTDPPTAAENNDAELQWRHEKLVLLERQRAEEQLRRDRFVSAISGVDGDPDLAIKSSYFALTEILRDERQRAGSDLSRFELLDKRLAAIAEESNPRPDAIAGCREIAASRIDQLKQNRDALRSMSQFLLPLEPDILGAGCLSEEARQELTSAVAESEAVLSQAPTGWQSQVSESDRKIREILAAGGEREFDSVRNILLIDGAETASLEANENRVQDSVEALKIALESGDDEQAELSVAEFPEPDEAFVEPSALAPESSTNGFHDLTRDSTSIPLPANGSETSVIFRSNNAELWGQDVYRGANARARALRDLPNWAKWISITRLDTGERIFAPADTASLKSGEGGTAFGFNGTNELFYGARHLGIFAESCPNEVETRFTYGGWGFGHRVRDVDSDTEELQASGWEGREIDTDTVFEISIHRDLPELSDVDKVLEANGAAVSSLR